jgi:hypothetical protein
MRVGVCALSLFLAPLCVAAPAPLPRQARPAVTAGPFAPHDLSGDWVMTWGDREWRVSLSAFGSYRATSGSGLVWAGTWFVDGLGSLHVSEAATDENGRLRSELTWSVVWERGKDGRFDARCLRGVVHRPDSPNRARMTLRRPRRK